MPADATSQNLNHNHNLNFNVNQNRTHGQGGLATILQNLATHNNNTDNHNNNGLLNVPQFHSNTNDLGRELPKSGSLPILGNSMNASMILVQHWVRVELIDLKMLHVN